LEGHSADTERVISPGRGAQRLSEHLGAAIQPCSPPRAPNVRWRASRGTPALLASSARKTSWRH